jgi:hypothetical protein
LSVAGVVAAIAGLHPVSPVVRVLVIAVIPVEDRARRWLLMRADLPLNGTGLIPRAISILVRKDGLLLGSVAAQPISSGVADEMSGGAGLIAHGSLVLEAVVHNAITVIIHVITQRLGESGAWVDPGV